MTISDYCLALAQTFPLEKHYSIMKAFILVPYEQINKF